MDVSRRLFVRTFLLNTAWMAGLGGTQRLRLAGELVPSPDDNRGVLNIHPEDYPALAESGGSVRLGFNPVRSNHLPDGTLHPILINRLESGGLIVLNAECPHASCAVRTLSQSSNTHTCPCHASRFGVDGRRISGPAPFGLEVLDSEICPDGSLDILVPRLKFSIASKVLDLGIFKRIKIDFPARRKVSYQVVFKSETADDWQIVPFATSEGATLSQSVFPGEGLLTSLFVDVPKDQGIFAVQILQEEV